MLLIMKIIKLTEQDLTNIVKRVINESQLDEAYKWRPSASQRKAFAQKMQDPDEQIAYQKRKDEKADKRRSTSKYDYNTAGGQYVPTQAQYDFVMRNMDSFNTSEEIDAANMVMFGYTSNEKVNHDYIHVVNEKRRSKGI